MFRGTYRDEGVAIKEVSITTDNDCKSFLDEVRVLNLLVHAHITRFFGGYTNRSKGVMVLELFECSVHTSLYVAECTIHLDQREKAQLLSDVIDAMAYLHSGRPKVIHRDLKPENIMLTKRKEAKLIDFGLATTKQSSQSRAYFDAAGTVAYMAPELFGISAKGSHKVDQYAFAVTINEIFSSVRPFFGEPRTTVEKIVRGGKRPEVGRDVPEWFCEVMYACWNKDPKQRPEFAAIRMSLREHRSLTEIQEEAFAKLEVNDILGAADLFREAVDKHQDPQSMYMLGTELQKVGKHSEAERWFRKAYYGQPNAARVEEAKDSLMKIHKDNEASNGLPEGEEERADYLEFTKADFLSSPGLTTQAIFHYSGIADQSAAAKRTPPFHEHAVFELRTGMNEVDKITEDSGTRAVPINAKNKQKESSKETYPAKKTAEAQPAAKEKTGAAVLGTNQTTGKTGTYHEDKGATAVPSAAAPSMLLLYGLCGLVLSMAAYIVLMHVDGSQTVWSLNALI